MTFFLDLHKGVTLGSHPWLAASSTLAFEVRRRMRAREVGITFLSGGPSRFFASLYSRPGSLYSLCDLALSCLPQGMLSPRHGFPPHVDSKSRWDAICMLTSVPSSHEMIISQCDPHTRGQFCDHCHGFLTMRLHF